ncbi:GNAT family N-acetyltransferase [Crenobacter cavernae]|uniref:GNAT family N-acetyltransferase n=1 Tax=Crenobacter cavernae TaxID=2290923 RepID=UPI001F0BFB88|nr:GNAT family N-acetyltransferase [Crenobacter cavernae]
MSVKLRSASGQADADADAVGALLREHGPNQWNWLPEDGVATTLAELALGVSHAELAVGDAGALLGALVWRFEDRYPALRPTELPSDQAVFVVEAVVHRDAAGQGLGVKLLNAAIAAARRAGATWLVADRHDENAASAGMMRKAGMVEIDNYADPARRPAGNRRSAVCAIHL